ncbi:MAG: leucine-rich repeat protein [Clostridia bacterium]|nr:leucine-rich repeat protein [Clostridia bacterium]
MKKILSLILAFLLIMSVVPMGVFTLTASAETYTDGYYTYTVSNGKATITGCDDSISGDITIPSTLGGYPVTSIGDYAFHNCFYITSVNIPYGVTRIGDAAFYCHDNWSYVASKLTSVTIPDSVTTIGDGAFRETALKNVIIPDSVTRIESTAFCITYIEDIVLGKGVTYIGEHAFSGSSLENVWYRGSEDEKAKIQMGEDEYIHSATWHYNICNTDEHVYDDDYDATCNNCEWVREHDCIYDNNCDETCNICGEYRTVPHIYDNDNDATCNNCEFVREIVYLESSHPYEDDCDEMWEYTYPTDADSLIITFSDDTETESGYDYIYILDANDNQIGEYSGTALAGESVVVPGNSFKIRLTSDGSATRNGFKVVKIEPHAHSYDDENDYICDCGLVREHDCVYDNNCDDVCNWCNEKRDIVGNEFYFENLKYKVLQDRTLSIVGYDNDPIYELNIPSSVYGLNVVSIDNYVFSSCSSLTSVTIPKTIRYIGERALSNSISIINIASLKSWIECYKEFPFGISKYDLYLNGNLVTGHIVIEDDIICIGRSAFSGCNNITEVTIPYGITIIDVAAFSGCSSLKKVNIPNGVLEISWGAFAGCSKLENINFPDSLITLGASAFSNCVELKSISIPKNVETIVVGNPHMGPGTSTFYGCTGLESITVDSENTNYHSQGNCLIKTQTKELILSCKNSVIPNDGSVVALQFSSVSLYEDAEAIVVPNAIQEIGLAAFYKFEKLKSVFIPIGVTNIEMSAFFKCNNLTDVWYEGSEDDRNNIFISTFNNDSLLSATWHYNTCNADEHIYDNKNDATCNNCEWIREVEIVKVPVGDIEIDIMPGDELPLDERIDTKYILGWKNPDGSKYEGTTYAEGLVAEFVETKMMAVKYQLGRDGNSIRYIASIDETERYNSVGWVFSITNENPEIGGANVTDKNAKKVYNGIIASGQVIDAVAIYGEADYSKYLYVFEITDIPEAEADTPIYVRPYIEMNDGRIVYGDVSAQTLNGLKLRAK